MRTFREYLVDLDLPSRLWLIEQDRREFIQRWNKWADEPITPHLVVRVIPGVYFEEEIAEGVRTTEAMVQYAADYARRLRKKVWLVLSRRLTIYFEEDGTKHVQKAVPGRCNTPFMQLVGSKQKFRFTDGMAMRPLNEPEEHRPK
jgi:hypothetical protein